MRLRAQLLILLAIALAPAGVLAVVQAVRAYRAQLASLEASLAQTARLAANEHENVVAGARDILRNLSTQTEILTASGECDQALARAISGLQQYSGAARTDAQGRVVCGSSRETLGIEVDDRQWFRELAIGRHFVISDLLASRLPGSTNRGIVVAQGLIGEAGQFDGALSVLVDLNRFAAQYIDTRLPESSSFALLDGAGNTLSQRVAALSPTRLPRADQGDGPRLTAAVFRGEGMDGIRRMYVVEPLLDGRLFVLLGVPTAAVLNPLTWQAIQVVLLPVIMWLLTAAVIWFGLERLVLRWLRYLERITSLYAEGRRGVRPERIVAAPAEIRSLGETFSRMADLIDVHETELRDSLEQKEMLVREVHHRVKNNLQLVMSLLSLHGRRVRDPHAELAFMEVRERITALATLHRRLYESETLDSVDLRWFLEDLCAELRKGGAPGSRAVRLETDIDSVEFSAGAAVPLGLLVTEAISNAYKHAFRDESSGSIRLTAHRLEGEMLVSVADDGVGGRPGTGEPDESGLGRSLMESFAKQLGGTLEVETTTEGTRVGVRFPMATAKEAA